MFRRLLATVAVFAVLGTAAFLLFGTFILAIAVLSPVGGASYLGFKSRSAGLLWQSRGRIELPDATRLIGANRARGLAIGELGQGLGGLALSLVPTWFVFGPRTLIIPSLALGFALVLGFGVARRRLSEGAKPIDILPPE